MLLCEVALGNIKEIGIREDEDDDTDKPLDVKEFHSRKGVGRQIPDPKHTIVRDSGWFFDENVF
jgi:poly [ADP-ribose] polymerase